MPKSFVVFVSSLAFLACQSSQQDGSSGTDSAMSTQSPAAAADTGSTSARLTMRDAAGREIGTLTITESADGMMLDGSLTSLPPGVHAIHLHTVGSCEAPAFTSAGGHWNPTSRQHGADNPQGPHLGDMPNITVNAEGSVTVNQRVQNGTLRGANALLDADGAAVVVHANADDYRTDPAGNAGDRIACGVVSNGAEQP